MKSVWTLPQSLDIGGVSYPIHADFRDILNIIQKLEDTENPNWLNWRIAIALFYEGEIPKELEAEAMEKLAQFIAYDTQDAKPAPKLIDWEKDATAILAGTGKAAGFDLRSKPFLHWWTFLAFFNAIGEGQLLTTVGIREKQRTGKKLEKWEQEYYRKNKDKVDLPKKYTREEQSEIDEIMGWFSN